MPREAQREEPPQDGTRVVDIRTASEADIADPRVIKRGKDEPSPPKRHTCRICGRVFVAATEGAVCTGPGTVLERDEETGVLGEYAAEHSPTVMTAEEV